MVHPSLTLSLLKIIMYTDNSVIKSAFDEFSLVMHSLLGMGYLPD